MAKWFWTMHLFLNIRHSVFVLNLMASDEHETVYSYPRWDRGMTENCLPRDESSNSLCIPIREITVLIYSVLSQYNTVDSSSTK